MDQALPATRLRILVAEDEPLAAMVIEDVLTGLGHTVLLAADGQEALGLAEAAGFDLLVTDLAMPRVTGWELIPRLRATRPDLPVVVMTGFLSPHGQDLLRSHEDGPLALLLKPFAPEALVNAIRDVAARSLPGTGNPSLPGTGNSSLLGTDYQSLPGTGHPPRPEAAPPLLQLA